MGPRPTRRRTCGVDFNDEEDGDILLALSTKRRPSRRMIDDESEDNDASSIDNSNDDVSSNSSVKEIETDSEHDELDDENDEIISDEEDCDGDDDQEEEDSNVASDRSDCEDTVSDQEERISADVDVTPVSVLKSDDEDEEEDPWENEEESDYEPEEDDDEELEADIDLDADELRPLQRNLNLSIIEPLDSAEKALDSQKESPCIKRYDETLSEQNETLSEQNDHVSIDDTTIPAQEVEASASQESDIVNKENLDQSHEDQDSIIVEAIVCEDDENVEEVVAEIIDDADEEGVNCLSTNAASKSKSCDITSATKFSKEDPVSLNQNAKSVDEFPAQVTLDRKYSESSQKSKPEKECPINIETFSSLSNSSNADSITDKVEYSNHCQETPDKVYDSTITGRDEENACESRKQETKKSLSPKQIIDYCDNESLPSDDIQVSSSVLLENQLEEEKFLFPSKDGNSSQQACNDKSFSFGIVPSIDTQPDIEKKILDINNNKLEDDCVTLSQKMARCVIRSPPTSSRETERRAVKFVDSCENLSTSPEPSNKHSLEGAPKNNVSASTLDEQNKENSRYNDAEADQSVKKGGETLQPRRMDLPKYGREGSVRRGQWKLGTKIGSGAFGVVHVGMNTFNGTLMAVKSVKMRPEAMKDAKREIQLLKSLKHKNVVQYYGAEMDSKYLHIFQEWVPAGSISSLLSKFGPFPLVVCCNYLAQISEGLAYLHENHVMHRDIKGSNILVNEEGIVKLADFGASKRISELHSNMMLSLTMRGTPYFMAPEVFEEKYSSKADIWSVGCVAYQMLMGTPPWKSLGLSNPVSLFNHISRTTGPPEPLLMSPNANTPTAEEKFLVEAFKRLVVRCFERNPENRPEAKDIVHDTLFTAIRMAACDDHSDCSRLFSPSSDRTFDLLASPSFGANVSPIRPSPRRTQSIGSPMTPFLSPPLPRKTSKSRLSSPIVSPIADPSEWPTWARTMHKAATRTQDIIAKTDEGQKSNSMIDSLNFSDDDFKSLFDKSLNSFIPSTELSEKNLTSSSAQASLRGLQFVNSTSTTDKKRGSAS